MRFNARQLSSVIEHSSFTGLETGTWSASSPISNTFQEACAKIWRDATVRAEKKSRPGTLCDGKFSVAMDWEGGRQLINLFWFTAIGYTSDSSFLTKAVKVLTWPMSSVVEAGMSKPTASIQPEFIKNRYYTLTGILASDISSPIPGGVGWKRRDDSYDSKGFLTDENCRNVWNASKGLAIHFDILGDEQSNLSLWTDILAATIKDTGSGLVDLGGKALEIGKWILIAGALIGGAVLVSRVLPSSPSPPPRKE